MTKVAVVRVFVAVCHKYQERPKCHGRVRPVLIKVLVVFIKGLTLTIPMFSKFPVSVIDNLVGTILVLCTLAEEQLFRVHHLTSSKIYFNINIILAMMLFVGLSPCLVDCVQVLLPTTDRCRILVFSFIFLVST